MVLLFTLLAVALTAVYIYFASFVLWKVLLVFAGGFLAVNLLYMGFWAVVSLFVDMSKPISRRNAMCTRGIRRIAQLAASYAMLRVNVTGFEKLPENERFLLVCNHRSLFDPIILFNKLDSYEVAFISKRTNMSLPVLGRIAYGGGCIGMDRENDRNALRSIMQAADYMKKDLCSMIIFPEGTRNRTEETLLPFHPGSFKIAQKAGAPLVIACLKGTADVKKNIFRRFTDTEIQILQVIPAEEVKKSNTRQLADLSSEMIRNCLKR